jgi:hypothetical protein
MFVPVFLLCRKAKKTVPDTGKMEGLFRWKPKAVPEQGLKRNNYQMIS